ncbi:MAG: hypothetical protein PHP42_09600 [Bacteroidota bacterium]|nr:hypothetical protein [Bacteroidota bacterium]
MLEHLMCENHSEMKAVAACYICGKPVCGDCAISQEGKTFCDDLSHSTMNLEYENLLTTPTEFEMALIVKNLEANGVSGKWFNPMQYGTKEYPRLFVLPKDVHRATDLLKELDLLDFTLLNIHDK